MSAVSQPQALEVPHSCRTSPASHKTTLSHASHNPICKHTPVLTATTLGCSHCPSLVENPTQEGRLQKYVNRSNRQICCNRNHHCHVIQLKTKHISRISEPRQRPALSLATFCLFQLHSYIAWRVN
jgi:hypothetical protein